MLNRWLKSALLFVLAVNAAALFMLWRDPAAELELRTPGLDQRPEREAPGEPVQIVGELASFDVEPGRTTGRWPQFRGERRDGIAWDERNLAGEWPAGGPPVLWSIDVGEGYAGAAVFDGRVYMIDYDRENQGDLIRCISLDTGADIWRYYYPVQVKRNHGMSRTVPAVSEDYVVTIGPKGHVTCLDARTGEFLWMIDLEAEYGTKVPPWYAGQCPLMEDGRRVIIAPAGDDVLMMAVDCATGEVLWDTPNVPGWNMTHSSITPMEFAGRDTYVYCGSRGVAGVCARTGELLWHTDKWQIRIAMVPSPVVVGEDRIFLTGGYNAGSVMMRLTENEGRISVEEEFRLDARHFASEQQTPILYGGHIYAVRPDGRLACMDTGGELLWTSDGASRYGLGPLLIADGMLYVMDDYGELTLVKADPSGFNRLASARVMDGYEAWGPMALAGGRLIVRDITRMLCLDIGL